MALIHTDFIVPALSNSLSIEGALHISDSTPSTTIYTGAIVTNGGAGVAKDLNVGGEIESVGRIISYASQDSINTTTGGIISYGGLGVAKTAVLGTGFMLGSGPAVCTQYASAVLTGTCQGVADITSSLYYSAVGTIKNINCLASCTIPNNTPASVIVSLPSSIPAPLMTNAVFSVIVSENATYTIGVAQFSAPGSITVYKDAAGTSFAANAAILIWLNLSYA